MRWRNLAIVIGLALAPMTSLRIWKVGPAEAALAFWVLFEWPALVRLRRDSVQVLFWVGFLGSLVVGTAYGVVFYPAETVPLDVLTWVYLMIVALCLYAGLHRRPKEEVEATAAVSATVASLLYTALLVYSWFVSPVIGSLPLTYGVLRFSGGAENPHQLAVLMCAAVFIHYRAYTMSRTVPRRLCRAGLCLASFGVGLATGSSTLVMAVALTVLYGVSTAPVERVGDRRGRVVLYLVMVALVVGGLAVYGGQGSRAVLSWIRADPNGPIRLSMYSSIPSSLEKSALFGLGPGAHALGGTMEYHNTYLEILAMSGLVGLCAFMLYAYRQLRLAALDRTLVMIVMPLYLYGLAGFAMRRLAYWVITMMVVVIAEKVRRERAENSRRDPAHEPTGSMRVPRSGTAGIRARRSEC